MPVQNQLGINMAQIFSNVSNIKSVRQSRDQAKTQFNWVKNDRTRQKSRREAVSTEVKSLGFADGLSLQDVANLKNIKGADRKQAIESINFLGNLTYKINTSDKPSETYNTIRDYMVSSLPEIGNKMPKEYDPKYVTSMSKMLIQADDVVKNNIKKVEAKSEGKILLNLEKVKQQGETTRANKKRVNALNLQNKKQEDLLNLEKVKQQNRVLLKSMTPVKKLKLTKVLKLAFDMSIPKIKRDFYMKQAKKIVNIPMSTNDLFLLMSKGTMPNNNTPIAKTADNYLEGL